MRKWQRELAEDIVGRLARRHCTAATFHDAVAERWGLAPTNHKCLDLLRERGPMAGSDLGAITGLTSGTITGVVARLERAGYLRREPDPLDGRGQIFPFFTAAVPLHDVIVPLREDMAELLENFDTHQLTAIAQFLDRTTELDYRHAALLQAETVSNLGQASVDKARSHPQPC